MRLPSLVLESLACPCCERAALQQDGNQLHCSNPSCSASFPVVNGCPVLINEANSLFSISDYMDQVITTMDLRDESDRRVTLADKIKGIIGRITPSVSRSVTDFPVEAALDVIARELPHRPRVLVIGAGDSEILLQNDCDIVFSDVAQGSLTQLICDAHDIPFPDGYFDAVFAVAVMEHVLDPQRCVSEIVRVLSSEGFVYSITPFMQQVHMGRYDFTRFTHLGHRLLFRQFSEERSGVSNAQGMVLAWSIERFFCGFSETPVIHSLMRSLARFVAFPFLLFDGVLSRKAPAYDAASGYYFFGRKTDMPTSIRELVSGYKGMQ